jgi:hypothetical protein
VCALDRPLADAPAAGEALRNGYPLPPQMKLACTRGDVHHPPLRITDYGLRITDYGLRITDYGLRITDYGLRVCGWRGMKFSRTSRHVSMNELPCAG